MVNIMYALVAFMATLVVLTLMTYNAKSSERTSKDFKIVMVLVLAFTAIDAMWGVSASHFFGKNLIVLYILSVLFHAAALLTSFAWYMFAVSYIHIMSDFKIRCLSAIPVFVGLILLALNPLSNGIFYIDQDLVYHSGYMRVYLFAIEYFYFILIVLITALYLVREKNGAKRYRGYSVLMFGIVPVLFGILQYIYPNGPFISCGYMISSIFVFIGVITADREKKSADAYEHYKVMSEENYAALQGIARGFVSIHIFNLKTNIQHSVQSTPHIDKFILPEDGADVQIKKVMAGVAEKEYVDDLLKFVDFHTLQDRMKGKRMISHEFVGKNQGWCMSSFIKIEEDSDGNMIRCLHAVQNIQDMKKREKDYQDVINAAYEDKNFMYSEMLRLQSVGIMSTDNNNHIYVMNDAAARLFGYPSAEDATNDFRDVLAHIKLEDEERAWKEYDKFMANGDGYVYYFTSKTYSGREAYVMGVPKLVRMKNGKFVVITCFSDISRKKEVEEKLITLSETDALTGINNRGSGETKIEEILARGGEGTFFMLDINRFKKINDRYGHSVGDKALQTVADCLRASFRDKDVVMRLGGDEYVVFAENIIDKLSAERCIRRFFESIEKARIEEMGSEKLTISLGATIALKEHKKDFKALYDEADSVMYTVKNQDGSNFSFFSSST